MRVAIVDIETTGFNHRSDVILEIGIAELDTLRGTVVEKFSSVCREPHIGGRHHKAWIFDNSSMTHEEVRAAPTLEDIRERVQYELSLANRVTAFNKQFDFGFLRHRRFEIDPQSEWPCLMLAATNICKLPHKKNGRRARTGDKYKWPSVEEAWAHFFPDVPYVEEHRGGDDAKHEAMIALELYKLGVLEPADSKAL